MIIAKLGFFIANAFEFGPHHLFCPNEWETNIIVVLPVGFLSLAVVINLRNWIYYHIKIGEMAYLNEMKKENFHLYRNAKSHINVLNVCTYIIITLNLLFLVCTTTINIVGSGNKDRPQENEDPDR